ncbi:MAG TPA: hypothetical protein VEZ24_09560 [Microvirga sp.]|nr:hypothetical protein [Microvirga sp.]
MNSIMERAHKWIIGHDTGASSEAIWAHMMNAGEPRSGWFYPLDPADLGRCLRLLELIPEWKPRLPEMAAHSKEWAALVSQWGHLAQSMADEVGIDWSKGDRAPKTYRLMKEVLDLPKQEQG